MSGVHRYSIPIFFGTDDSVLVEVCHSSSFSCVPLLPRPLPSPYLAVCPQTGLPSMSRSKQVIICKSVSGRSTIKGLRHHNILEVPKILSTERRIYYAERESRTKWVSCVKSVRWTGWCEGEKGEVTRLRLAKNVERWSFGVSFLIQFTAWGSGGWCRPSPKLLGSCSRRDHWNRCKLCTSSSQSDSDIWTMSVAEVNHEISG